MAEQMYFALGAGQRHIQQTHCLGRDIFLIAIA